MTNTTRTLKTWPNYKLPPTYHLGDPGNACYGEPPNHPRYFIRSIYTQHGNNPPYGKPQYILNNIGYEEIEQVDKFFKFFKPLPLEHPRTQE